MNKACTASSAAAVTKTSTSSPDWSVVSPRGTMRRSARTTATTTASRGKSKSAIAMSLAGESSANVISTRWATPPLNWRSRTSEPTETASSTSAVSSWGVETETSTPQLSLKSHWFLGWLTRATTRGTANSCLANSETTRWPSSSPVAATTTSTVARPAASSDDTSQASAAIQVTSSVGRSRSTRSGSCSNTITSWPLACRSAAMAVPTLPAPAMATFTWGRRSLGVAGLEEGIELGARVGQHGHVQHVSLLTDQLARIEPGDAGPGHGDQAHLSRIFEIHQTTAGPGVGERAVRQGESTRRVRPVIGVLLGQEPSADLVDGPRHRGHGRDAQALVDLGPARIVDPGHHIGDEIRLAGDAHRHDVGVVPAGHRGQRVGSHRAGPLQVIPVETRSRDPRPIPVLEAAEGPGVAVHNRHGVTLGREGNGQSRPDPAASHHDHVHATVQHATPS